MERQENIKIMPEAYGQTSSSGTSRKRKANKKSAAGKEMSQSFEFGSLT